MKFITHLLILVMAIVSIESACKEAEEVEANVLCTDTEYQSYVDCIRKRMKRSTNCEEDDCGEEGCGCNQCDCNYCSSNSCEQTCTDCCRTQQNVCQSHHCCHKTCHSQCKTSSCRKSCRKSCTDKIVEKEKVTHIHHSSSHGAPLQHNITTVINLKNMINNTNIIDMPITLNNTNINNITLETSEQGSILGPGPIIDKNCCHLLGPRQCVPIAQYPFNKCYHVRYRQCGQVCQAPIVHEQKHTICDQEIHGAPTCREQSIYIPQPRPRCAHQQKWPYVVCGILEAECGGCYAHHSSGEKYAGGCPSACFDDGYGAGPMYRQGPYYRQGYAPMPSCYQLGNCNVQSMQGQGGFGFYGGGYPPQSYDAGNIGLQPSDFFVPMQTGAIGNIDPTLQGNAGPSTQRGMRHSQVSEEARKPAVEPIVAIHTVFEDSPALNTSESGNAISFIAAG